MNPAVRVLKNSTALTISILLERALAFFLPWYVARILGRETWGYYSTALTFVLIAEAIAPWGFVGLLPREVARDWSRSASYLTNSLLVTGVVSIGSIALIVLVAWLLDYPQEVAFLIYTGVILTVLPAAESLVFEAVITGVEKMEWIVAARFPLTVLRIVGSIYLLASGRGVEVLFYMLAAYYLVLCFVYFLILRRNLPHFFLSIDLSLARQLAARAFPFFIIVATSQVFIQLDRVFLSKLWDTDAVGIYSTGILVIQLIYMIAPAVMQSLYPGLSRAFLVSRERYSVLVSQIFKLLYIGAYPLMISIIAFAELMILVVFGEEYQPSVLVLRIVALGILPSFLSRILYRSILASDHERDGIFVSIFGSLFSLTMVVLLIPSLGVTGASIAAAGTMLFNLLINYLYARKVVRLDMRKALIRPTLCALVSMIGFGLLLQWNYLLAWIVGMILFTLMVFLTRTLRLSEIREMTMAGGGA